MPTTVHIPELLLERVDTRAKALGISRNRVIIDALEASLGTKEEWPPELLQLLRRPLSARASEEFAESMAAVRRGRVNRRRAPRL